MKPISNADNPQNHFVMIFYFLVKSDPFVFEKLPTSSSCSPDENQSEALKEIKTQRKMN